MKTDKKMIKLSLVLILGGFMLIGSGDDTKKDDSMGGEGSQTPQSNNPMKIYPQNPVVAKDGNLKLLPVVTEGGKILEDSDDHTLYATYKVKDSDILTIGSQGDVVGKNPGETEVTITIKDENTSKTYTNKVNIKVAVVDVSKLFLNPSVAALKKGESKEFTLTALDSDKSATLIEAKYMKFNYQKSQIDLNARITNEFSKVNVTAKEAKGYSFVTPTFQKAGVTVTGDSTLIQFTSTPQSNAPSGATGGNNIDFIRVKKSGGDDLYVVHTGDDLLYFESFKHKQGKWSRTKLDTEGSTIEYPKIYKDSALHVIVVEDNIIYKFTSEDNGGGWSKTKLLDKSFAISSENHIQVAKVDSKTLLALATDKLIEIYDITGTATKLFSMTNDTAIKSISITANKDKKLRMVFSDDTGLNYLTEQNGKYYKKEIITGSGIEKVKIAYSKYNVPSIMYYKDSSLVEAEKTKSGAWSKSNISNLQFTENGLDGEDALNDIRDFDFVVDRYGNSRIIVADNEKLYYIKEYGDINSKDWRIDEVIEKDVGDYVSLAIDNKSRLKAIFHNNNTEWIKYWAEPVYVKYRDKSTKNRVVDTLDTASSDVIEIVTTLNNNDVQTEGGATSTPIENSTSSENNNLGDVKQ